MHEAKTHFSKLIGLVEGGQEVVVQRGDKPVAKIVPYGRGARARQFGVLRGAIKIADDFDVMPEDFEGYAG